MKPPDKERTFLTLAVAGLAALLIVLGILQYRWSGEISQAASDRMQATLQKSMSMFRDRLTREITEVCRALQPMADIDSGDGAAQYSRRFLHWQAAAAHAGLVKTVYFAERRNAGAPVQIFRLDPAAEKFEASEWPTDLASLQHSLDHLPEAPPFLRPDRPRPEDPQRDLRPPDDVWVFDQAVPTLICPIFNSPPDQNREVSQERWLILRLDKDYLQQRMLPDLARSQFALSGQFDFKVAVIGGTDDQPVVVYSTEQGFGDNPQARFAGRMKLWGPPRPPERSDQPGPPPGEAGAQFRAGEPAAPVRLFVLHGVPGDRDWELVVDPRSGSFEATVASLRRRNLVVSFGILLILAGTITAIVLTTARARRLAALQMEFVTGVTHELRTPLAVILSASENIKDGVVSTPSQLARYGDMIHRQARQLMQLVEQVLLFASSRQAQLKFDVQPIEVIPVVEAALEAAKDSGIVVERTFDANVPMVNADPVALTQCLQNLVGNAVKYGGAGTWIGVEVRVHDERGLSEVQVTVRDHGIGIEASELPNIFDPFYRSPKVAASNVHGTGLGLSLARNMIEAMGGRITVQSQIGRGSSFTVHLQPVTAAHHSEPGEESNTYIPHV